jgi:hypothetical protein
MSETPRTAVPDGIADPVERARAELKAALAAIEDKANVPKRVARATERNVTRARRFANEKPVAATVAVVGAALAVGATVWGLVRAYVR